MVHVAEQSQSIQYALEEGTAWIDLNTNAENSFALADFEQLSGVLDQAAQTQPAVLVLRSARPGVFSHGLNLAALHAQADPDAHQQLLFHFHDVLRKLYEFPAPVLAELRGHTLGYGAMLALCADFRLAVEGLRIGLPEVKLGLRVPSLVALMLRDIVGAAEARRHILLGTPYKANEAQAVGLLDELYPTDEELRSAARKLAQKLSRNSVSGARMSRAALAYLSGDLERMVAHDIARTREALDTPDAIEGIAAAVAGRRPEFQRVPA